MTQRQFRWILGAYILVVLLNFFVGALTQSMIPAAVRDLSPALSTQSMPLLILILLFVFVLLGAALVGFIGLFFFWSPSRWIFLIAVLLKILASPAAVIWLAETGWETVFGELELLLDGIILTLCFVGPARGLFKRKDTESNQPLEGTH